MIRILSNKVVFFCLYLTSQPPVSETRPLVFCSSFIDWNATCEGRFPNVYCPLEMNDYNAFPEGKSVEQSQCHSFVLLQARSRKCVSITRTWEECAL